MLTAAILAVGAIVGTELAIAIAAIIGAVRATRSRCSARYDTRPYPREVERAIVQALAAVEGRPMRLVSREGAAE